MRYFSYNEYIDCTENGGINKLQMIEEKVELYELKECKNKKREIEERFTTILKNKYQLKVFLNQFFNFFHISELKELEFLNYKEKNLISCKVKDKEIFVIVKIIQNIDNNISFKMFEYSIELIKKWENENRTKHSIRPIVIPIVFYVGNRAWNNNYYKNYNNVKYVSFEENRIDFSYNMLDINQISISDLDKQKSIIIKEIIKSKNKYLRIN